MVATTVIHDACEAGALTGMLASRFQTGLLASAYANLIAEASAIATQFVTVNNNQTTPLDDTDKTSIGAIVQNAAAGVFMGRPAVTEVQPPNVANYSNIVLQIYSIAREAVLNGGLSP